MSNIVFPLFGRDGWVNPTPALRDLDVPFYDAATQEFRLRQGREFDGGWRYWEHYDADYMTIYNVGLDRRAYADLALQEIEDTRLLPETLLDSVKGWVVLEHTYYHSKNWLEDHIRALSRRTEIEIIKEIRGDDDRSQPFFYSVRKPNLSRNP